MNKKVIFVFLIVLLASYLMLSPPSDKEVDGNDVAYTSNNSEPLKSLKFEKQIEAKTVLKSVKDIETHKNNNDRNEVEEETEEVDYNKNTIRGGYRSVVDIARFSLMNNPPKEAPTVSPYGHREYRKIMLRDGNVIKAFDGAHRINKFTELDQEYFSGHYQSIARVDGVDTVYKLKLHADENQNIVGCLGVHFDDDQKPVFGSTTKKNITFIQTKNRHQLVVNTDIAYLILYRVWPTPKNGRSHIMYYYKKNRDGYILFAGHRRIIPYPKSASLDDFCKNPDIVYESY